MTATAAIRLRPGLELIGPYVSGRSGSLEDERFAGAALLASNELPFAPLPSVLDAIGHAAASAHRYPDPAATELREAIAAGHGLSAGHVAVGAGSVEVCRQALSAVAGPGDEVVFAEPSFAEYRSITLLAGATPVPVPLAAATHDLEAMASSVTESTRAVVVCNPNNPTGTARPAKEVLALLDRLPGDVLVIIDEAYAEFADHETTCGAAAVRERNNVLVLRTFSKAYGLAGLRAGYGLAAPEVVEALARTRLPFGVNALAQAAATASLQPAAASELSRRVGEVVSERRRVVRELSALRVSVPEPQGNFVWFALAERRDEVAGKLAASGVLVRPLPGGLRATIGTPGENDRMLEALASVSPSLGAA